MGRSVTSNESALTGVTLSLMAERTTQQHIFIVCEALASFIRPLLKLYSELNLT